MGCRRRETERAATGKISGGIDGETGSGQPGALSKYLCRPERRSRAALGFPIPLALYGVNWAFALEKSPRCPGFSPRKIGLR